MAQTIRLTMGAIEWTMLLALSIIWGGSFLLNSIALRSFDPFSVVALRVGIGAVCLWLIAIMLNYPFPQARKLWVRFLWMGILNNAIPFTLIVWGQQYIASGLASILNATTPLFTVLVAHALLADERLSVARSAGVVIGFLGVAIMVGADALGKLGIEIWAQLAVLAASLSYAVASVFGRRFAGVPPMVTAAGQVTASSLIMIPLALVVEKPWQLEAPGFEAIAAVAGLGAISTAAAYGLYFAILSRAGATNLVLVTFLIPPSAVLLGVSVLGESITAMQLAGTAAIAAGLALIDGRVLRPLTSAGQSR
jgi:drug/metabolite transporter (DMT)-like permease